MGFADLCLLKKIAYGSQESIELGKLFGIPTMCAKLPTPRRNITLMTVAPTGTVSLIAGCSSGLEPVFSEITIRNDKTGTYTFENDLASEPYFRCAVSSNGATEVTWEEHIKILAAAQRHIDSGVSKTINFPNHARRETMAKAIMMAWKEGCKGLAIYRNGSRKTEVLSPKAVKKDKCPTCGNDLVDVGDKKKCVHCTLETAIENTTTLYD
jgi:ribonucleoside-diphosphate reductase alpha chain